MTSTQDRQPLITQTSESQQPEEDKCENVCKWLRISGCVVTSLLIVYLLLVNIGGFSGQDYFPNQKIVVSHNIGTDPFETWEECNLDTKPEIFGYHIHAVFDGNNQESCTIGTNAYYQFVDKMNPNMKQCTFSHSNSGKYQTEICYFPKSFKDDDFPMASNFIFQSTNYAFYIPKSLLQESISWWMQHHYSVTNENNNEINFDFVIHPVSGCQTNDHTKWLINSKDYNDQIISDNLLCCHNGPSECTCDISQLKLTDYNLCLTVKFNINDASFTLDTCEDSSNRGLGSWRETTYSEENKWVQFENFGDVTHPMYLCLSVLTESNFETETENVNNLIGSNVILQDCSKNQDITNNVWISENSKFIWDSDQNQVKFIGNNEELCLNVEVSEMISDENDSVMNAELKLQLCNQAAVFERQFIP